MPSNKDNLVMAVSVIEWRWLLLAVGFFSLLCNVCEARRTVCLTQPIQQDVTVLKGVNAGNFKKLGKTKNVSECLRKACRSHKGNIAYFLDDICFSVACYNKHLCDLEPTEATGVKTAGAVYRIIEAYPKLNGPRHVDVREDTENMKVMRFEATAESRTKRKEIMSYEIIRGNLAKTFRLSPETSDWGSAIYLLKNLDREIISTYGIQIRATNTKENVSSLLNVSINVLDANDNPPEFLSSPFVFNVFSNMSVGHLIGQLVARDNDTSSQSELEYTIKEQSELITYSKDTGKVRLGKTEKIDIVKEFTFDVTVTDGLYTTKGELRVVLYPNNVHWPVFERTSFKVRLNGQVPLNTEVQQVLATDPDYGKLGELTYVILDGDDDGVFTVTHEGVIKTRGNIPTDIEIYNLTIGVHDNGYPELHANKPANVVISLQWLRFNQDIYKVSVREDLPLLHMVFTAVAFLWVGGSKVMAGQRKRAVGGINYYLEGGLDRFTMEETSGAITLHEVLDYETQKVHVLSLKADYESADSTPLTSVLSAKALLRVEIQDVNDNRPRFLQLHYVQDVWKSSALNSPVLKINATDLDEGRNGLVHFEAVSGNFNETFSFEPDGMIFLKKSLERTEQPTFNMTVVSWDDGEPEPLRSEKTACIIINVRGNLPKSPKFTRDYYWLEISESVGVGIPIYQVNASVADKRWKVTYSFRNMNGKIPFRVDPVTGQIYTTRRLDREKTPVYVLPYTASAELGQTSHTRMVNVTISVIDENDNRPTFCQDYYSTVVTSPSPGTSILIVEAEDKDQGKNARVTYGIIKGRDKHYFHIDSRSGEITTRMPLPTRPLLALKINISAKDHGMPSLHSLKPAPVFVFIGPTFPIIVNKLKRTTTTMRLKFILVNVSLEDISHIGVVVQGAERIANYDEVTRREIVSWNYVHTVQDNGAYAQRYLTGKVTCTDQIRKNKAFDFTVGSDGDQCLSNKKKFCNGKLQAEKKYRFQLVAYFKNGTSPDYVTSIESNLTDAHQTDATNSKRTSGFRSWHYDVIVIILGVSVGVIILATIIRAFMLYRRDKFRMKNDETRGSISYPLSNPRYRRSGETPRSSRSTMSFTELNKSRKLDKKDKMSPCATDEEQQDEVDEDGSDKEMETELNT